MPQDILNHRIKAGCRFCSIPVLKSYLLDNQVFVLIYDILYILDMFKNLIGGEQQRVAIARALINRPEILLADEPTGNLDPHNAMEIMGLLEKINRRGTTVIVVTHSHEIVDMMKKRVITIDRGMVIRDEEESGYRYED